MKDNKKFYFILESVTGFIDGWYKFESQESFNNASASLCLSWDEKRPEFQHFACVLDSDKVFYIPDQIHLPRQSRSEIAKGFTLEAKNSYGQGVRNMANTLIETVVEVFGDHAVSVENLVKITDEIRQNDGLMSEHLYNKYNNANKVDNEKVIHIPLDKTTVKMGKSFSYINDRGAKIHVDCSNPDAESLRDLIKRLDEYIEYATNVKRFADVAFYEELKAALLTPPAHTEQLIRLMGMDDFEER